MSFDDLYMNPEEDEIIPSNNPLSQQLLDFVLDDDDAGHHTLKINPSEMGTHTISLVYGKVGFLPSKLQSSSDIHLLKISLVSNNRLYPT